MIMDPAEHAGLLAAALAGARRPAAPRSPDHRVRVHLSGHLCHAPRRELLEVIEASGAVVVDDDLYHGRRHVSTDVEEDGDPLEAIARWYQQRNVNIPCPTRVQQDADWDGWLLRAVRGSGAEAVIHLVPKFCEPHMLYYPELRKALDAAASRTCRSRPSTRACPWSPSAPASRRSSSGCAATEPSRPEEHP